MTKLDEQAMRDLKKAVKLAGSIAAYAKSIGVTRQYIHQVLKGVQEPGPKITDALGYDKKLVKR
jgi:DNA-binding transcriptional regulator YdaS (Cro superfamily)